MTSTALFASLPVPDLLPREVGGIFDLVGGLPVHPLIVHVAVIVFPAAAAALIVIMVLPRVHALVRWGVVATLAVGALAVWIAAESGEALSERVGEPEVHQELGENLPVIAGITLGLAVVWAVLAELAARASRTAAETAQPPSRAWLTLRVIASVVTAGMAVYAIYYTVLVGHSGAVATWLSRVGG